MCSTGRNWKRPRDCLEQWGRLDVLVNAAGGNMPAATLAPGASFFDLPVEGMEPVIALNLQGTLLPSQVFGEALARAGRAASSTSPRWPRSGR